MKDSFIIKTAELARAAPSQWNQFLQELDGYVNEQASKLIHQTPPELVQVNQGVVRGVSALYNEFQKILASADKVISKNSTQNKGT